MSTEEIRRKWREAGARYRAAHPDRLKASQEKYKANHPEAIKAALDKYKSKQENRVKMRKATANWRKNNKSHLDIYRKQYCIQNKEAIRKKNAAWVSRNPDKMKAYWATGKHKRRARILNAVQDEFVSIAIRKLRTSKRVSCYYCGCVTRTDGRHIDHIIPLSKGGEHSSRNLCIACSKCNMEKHDKTFSEWSPNTGQKFFKL